MKLSASGEARNVQVSFFNKILPKPFLKKKKSLIRSFNLKKTRIRAPRSEAMFVFEKGCRF